MYHIICLYKHLFAMTRLQTSDDAFLTNEAVFIKGYCDGKTLKSIDTQDVSYFLSSQTYFKHSQQNLGLNANSNSKNFNNGEAKAVAIVTSWFFKLKLKADLKYCGYLLRYNALYAETQVLI